jgi:hypothetical protein
VTKNRTLVFLGIAGGIICIGMAIMYWTVPEKSLPLPDILGHANSSAHHIKHGIAAFLVGLALFAFAWFKSGPRKKVESGSTQTPAGTDSAS